MNKTIKEIIEIYIFLVDYYLSGNSSLVVLETVYAQLLKDEKTSEDDLFIQNLITTNYNTTVLVIANLIKKNEDSINLIYFFNIIRNSKSLFGEENWKQLIEIITEFESQLGKITSITSITQILRDQAVAHPDKKQLTNPIAFIKNSSMKWGEINSIYILVSEGLKRIGRLLDPNANLETYLELSSIAKIALINKTIMVYEFLSNRES